MKYSTLLFVTLASACGTGSLLPGHSASLATVDNSAPGAAPAPGSVAPVTGGDPTTAPNPNTVADGNTTTPTPPADPNAGNPNTPSTPPPAPTKPVFTCAPAGGLDNCTVLGQPTDARVDAAAVLVQLPSTAAPVGEVFYAALVSNSSSAVAISFRGVMTDTGARIEIPPKMPLPLSTSSAAETYKVFVWSASTPMVALDLAPLVLYSTETPAASWGFILRAETRAIMGLQAVVDYTKLAAAPAPFDRTTLESTGGFGVNLNLINLPIAGPGSSGLSIIPRGMEIRDGDMNVVYTNVSTNGGDHSDRTLTAGKGYLVRLFPQTSLNAIGTGGQDPNDAFHFGDIGVVVEGDVQIYNLIGASSGFPQRF